MGFGLRALNRLAGSDLLDRIRLRKQVERALFQGTKNGFRSATAAGRTFKAAQQLGKPARQTRSKSEGPLRPHPRRRAADVPGGRPRLRRREDPPGRARRRRRLRDPDGAARAGRRARVNMLGVPEELGGVMHEQSAVDQRADRRGARARRHGHRLRGARPGRRRAPRSGSGAAPSSRRPTCRLHRRGRPRRRPGDPRAAAAVRPVEAADHGAARRRRVGARRRQVAGGARRRSASCS